MLARRAGVLLLARQTELGERGVEHKSDRELVTAADREAERLLVRGLREAYPEHAICAEEGVLTPAGRADRDAAWLWHIDPIDGTANFVRGLPFYCVALSASLRGELIAAVVHAPALRQTYTAECDGEARCDGRRLQVSPRTELRQALLATGFSYHRDREGFDDNADRVRRVLPQCSDLRRLGSAQLDLCLTAAGVLDGYWELHLQPYDLAAGALIVRRAGGRVTDLRGGDDWLATGHVLASNGHLHGALLEIVGDAKS